MIRQSEQQPAGRFVRVRVWVGPINRRVGFLSGPKRPFRWPIQSNLLLQLSLHILGRGPDKKLLDLEKHLSENKNTPFVGIVVIK